MIQHGQGSEFRFDTPAPPKKKKKKREKIFFNYKIMKILQNKTCWK
jgi:hypothetical protein